MNLTLDHHQRLNLFVLVGLPECGTIAETWSVWKLMDRLMLNDEEKQTVEFHSELINGSEGFRYNQAKTLPAREFELSESEIARIQKAVYSMNRVFPGQMRSWLQPLLAQLPEPGLGVLGNGDKLEKSAGGAQ